MAAERVRLEKQTRFNPTKGLTPDGLVARLEAWARGDIRDLAWTMEWVEKHDDICSSVADKARRAVSRYGYDVLPVEGIAEADEKLANQQVEKLREFYRSIITRHAVDSDERGRMGLLCRQLMDAYGQMYSCHHVVWKTSASGLTAEVIKVPLWHFENRLGKMAWLSQPWATFGTPLEQVGGESAWIVAKSRGVMLAGCIAYMFKHIPLQDWLTYCDRHGMPGFLGKTASEYGSAGWNAMVDAVNAIGSEFGGVVNTGDAIDVLDLTAQGNIPYPALVDRMDRAFTILWRGGDLGTISRGDGVGSNNQNEDTDDLDADNSMWVGETLDMSLGRRVIDYYFGEGTPMLAELRIGSRVRDDQTKQLAAVKDFVGMGGRVARSWFAKKFGIAEARKDETDVLGAKAKTEEPKTEDRRLDPEKPEVEIDDDEPEAGASNESFAGWSDRLRAGNDLANAVAKALDVQRERLSPVQGALGKLMTLARDGTVGDAELYRAAADVRRLLPDLFDPMATADVAGLLAGAMGAAFTKEATDKQP